MNIIPKICEMLGVEIGEEFHVILHGSPMMSRYRITKTQAQYQPLKDGEWVQAGRALECFLNGEAEIVKLTGRKWEEKCED